jgi:NAD(P)-dependent dehydrogenase (short-subunit alcohol dehydrogenase family)
MRTLSAILAMALMATAPAMATAAAATADAPPARAVLITGASTGIGRNATEYLASRGWFVYAGARKAADLEALGKIPNVQPLKLDVTQPADIAAAVESVTKAGRGLYALVNNAGIATVGSTAETSDAEFDLVMKINVYGVVQMTKAFLPLITQQKGRIVNIGSISGVLASPALPAYSMSKHAIEALTDSLAAQLAPQGVQVSVVEPGNYNSEIGKSAMQRLGGVAGGPAAAAPKNVGDRSMYKEPTEVSAGIAAALSEPSPKRRYMVVPNEDEASRTIRKQIEQLVQLNEGQAYTYDRAALVKMLDEALATSRPQTH